MKTCTLLFAFLLSAFHNFPQLLLFRPRELRERPAALSRQPLHLMEAPQKFAVGILERNFRVDRAVPGAPSVPEPSIQSMARKAGNAWRLPT